MKLRERMELLEGVTDIRKTLLETFKDEDFDVDRYLDIKAQGAFKRGKKQKPARVQTSKTADNSEDNINPELLRQLKTWRKERSEAEGKAAFQICHTRTLMFISNYLPVSYDELLMLPTIGPAIVKRIGDDVLDIVDAYRAEHPDAPCLQLSQ